MRKHHEEKSAEKNEEMGVEQLTFMFQAEIDHGVRFVLVNKDVVPPNVFAQLDVIMDQSQRPRIEMWAMDDASELERQALTYASTFPAPFKSIIVAAIDFTKVLLGVPDQKTPSSQLQIIPVEIVDADTMTRPLKLWDVPLNSPAQHFSDALSKWSVSNCHTMPTSLLGWMICAYGYRLHVKQFGEDHVAAIVRGSTATEVELHSFNAYPGGRGHGTAAMHDLCAMADSAGVGIWFDVASFGLDRKPVPLEKLRQFFMRFGFEAISEVQPDWICGYHRWVHALPMTDLMWRSPKHETSDVIMPYPDSVN